MYLISLMIMISILLNIYKALYNYKELVYVLFH